MTGKKDPYKDIAETYDLVMGARDEVGYLVKLVKRAHPKGKTILELGCGTGTLLKPFADKYEVTGLDASEPMLKKARKVIPHGRFYNQDMTKFELDEKFDIVLCLFNSLNHLGSFAEWKSTFRQCRKHLKKGGVFIFDINTPLSLEDHATDPIEIVENESRIMATQFSQFPDKTLQMHIRVFTHQGKNLYSLSESKILERAYPTQEVRRELKKSFSKVQAVDAIRKRVDRHSEVLYFVCWL